MDILYIVGKGSVWQDNELRYSLRSIAKNGRNVGRVFICGYIPRWVNTHNAICLPFADQTKCKHWNICDAILYAADVANLGGASGEFLYSSDDHFYVRPTDFDNYPYYCKGELPEVVEENDPNKEYYTTLVNTRKVLAAAGLTTHMFNWHGNTHFNAHLLRTPELRNLYAIGHKMTDGVEPTAIMLNYQLALQGFEITMRDDYKTPYRATKDDIERIANKRECISSVPSIVGSGLHKYLFSNFKQKSKYEL